MCEHCDEIVSKVWGEIRDLLKFGDGPLSTDLRNAIENDPRAIPENADQIRAAMIATRCAIIASYSEGNFKGAPQSLILGHWAGVTLEAEIKEARVIPISASMLSELFKDDADAADGPMH